MVRSSLLQVVARHTQHRIQRIAQATCQPAPVHPMIGLQMSDRRPDRLAALEPPPLLRRHRLEAPAMDDLDFRRRCDLRPLLIVQVVRIFLHSDFERSYRSGRPQLMRQGHGSIVWNNDLRAASGPTQRLKV